MTGNGSHSAAAGSKNRLYSYMSGSDGEEDQLRPTGRRTGHRRPAPGHGDAVDALSSCSSLSSVHSSSASDVDNNGRLVSSQQPRRSIDRMTDSVDSSARVGENVYSRIKEPGYATTFTHCECWSDCDDDEIAYFTVRWKTRASFVYRTKNVR